MPDKDVNDYNLNATPKFAQITGEPNQEVNLIYETTALSGLSLIIHSLNGLFNGQNARLAVSNDGVGWIDLKMITLDAGTDTVTRGYNDVNQSVLGSVLVFQKNKSERANLRYHIVGTSDISTLILILYSYFLLIANYSSRAYRCDV